MPENTLHPKRYYCTDIDCGKGVSHEQRLKIRCIPFPDEKEPRYVYKCPYCRGRLESE